MKLRLFGKEKGHTFVAGFGKHWLPMACVGIRSHEIASIRTPWSQRPAPIMKPNTLTITLVIMPNTERMACVTV